MLRKRLLGRALAHRNYRLFLAGQSISVVGTWTQQVAIGWLVYRLSGSAWLLGIVGFCLQFPIFLLGPLGGVVADRVPRHRALVITQTLAMLQATSLLILMVSGRIQIGQIIALSLLLGCVNAFDMPLRQSFLFDLVLRREDLPNAIALNSSSVNCARLIGPTIAGLLISVHSEAICFLFNALSYLAVLAALLAMRDLPPPRALRKVPWIRGLREGIAYAVGFRPILALLLMLALTSISSAPLTLLMPAFASDILHGGPRVLGYLTAASGLGALVSALHLASKQTVLGLGRQMASAASISSLAMIAFSYTETLLLSLPFLLVAGYGMMFALAANNTLLQTIVEDDKRGRVMSLYTMAFMGSAPLGSLLAGSVADMAGVPVAVRLLGAVTLCGTIVFAWNLPRLRRLVRPIYERAGILPPIASALHTTTSLTSPPEEA